MRMPARRAVRVLLCSSPASRSRLGQTEPGPLAASPQRTARRRRRLERRPRRHPPSPSRRRGRAGRRSRSGTAGSSGSSPSGEAPAARRPGSYDRTGTHVYAGFLDPYVEVDAPAPDRNAPGRPLEHEGDSAAVGARRRPASMPRPGPRSASSGSAPRRISPKGGIFRGRVGARRAVATRPRTSRRARRPPTTPTSTRRSGSTPAACGPRAEGRRAAARDRRGRPRAGTGIRARSWARSRSSARRSSTPHGRRR